MKTKNSQHFTSAILIPLLLFLLLSACGEPAAPPEPTEEEVENVEMTLTLERWAEDGTTKEEYERTGTYTGTVIDGIPNGKGRFDTQNSEGIAWYYEGDFKDGKFDGEGVAIWDDEDTQAEKGTYKNGCFTPDTAEFLAFAISASLNDYTMSETSISYIKSHPDFFPAKDEAALEKVKENMDSTISPKHLQKNVSSYLETFMTKQNLSATQVQEETLTGHTFTWMLAVDEQTYDYYMIFYPGSCGIYQGDRVSYIGLPVGFATFDNTNGGQTWASIVVASDVW